MMTKKVDKAVDKKEQLSALIDGQLNEQESQDILNALLNDDELQTMWLELHQIRNIHHNKLDDTLVKGDISSNVSSMLEKEPAHFVEDAVRLEKVQTSKVDWNHRSMFFKSGVGLAIAASVMFLTLNISQLITQPDTSQPLPTGQQMAGATNEMPYSDNNSSGKNSSSNNSADKYTPPAYVATKLSDSVRMPFAQTATFSQFDNISSQTVSSGNFLSLEKKKQYPLSADKVIDLGTMNKIENFEQTEKVKR